MGSLSIWHWLIVLVVVMLVFGTSKLKNIGRDLGAGIKGFKEGMAEGSTPPAPAEQIEDAAKKPAQTIDVQAREKS